MIKYSFTISKECYTTKPDVKYITWKPIELDAKEMFNYALSGYTITGDYGFKEEFLKGRTKANWKSSAFLYIDLDDVNVDWNTLTSRTYSLNDAILRPTGVYTTFSHNIKGNRYRLVYIFDKPITDQSIFANITGFYNNQISTIFSLGDGVDQCNRTVNQIMHGTNPTALKHYDGNIIRLDDAIGRARVKTSESKKKSKSKGKHCSKKDETMSKEELAKLCDSFRDYFNTNAFKYKIYTHNWFELGDTAKRKDVLDVTPKEKIDRKTGQITFYKFPDGTRRRKRLLTNARKIRVMNPNVTAEELKVNIVYYLTRGILQDGNKITWDDVDEIVNTAMNEDYTTYMKKREERLGDKANEIVKNPYTTPKRDYKFVSDSHTEEEVKLVVSYMNIEGIMEFLGCSRMTAYRLKDKYGIECDSRKANEKIIKELYIQGKKAKEIMEITGLRKSQVYDILKKLKEAGIEIAKVELKFDLSLTDNTNYVDNSVNFYEKTHRSAKENEFMAEFKNRYPNMQKFFKDRKSMNEFLMKYSVLPRKGLTRKNEVSMKITKFEDQTVSAKT